MLKSWSATGSQFRECHLVLRLAVLQTKRIPPVVFTASAVCVVLCTSIVVRAASFDGLNIPGDFAGHLLASQKIQTNYRDDTSPLQRYGEGSELDQLFVHPNIADGFLRIGVTGNLDTYPSRYPTHGIVVFLDTKPGGDAVLDGNSGGSDTDGDRFVTLMEGTTFDDGFAPDFAVIVNAVNPGHLPRDTFYVDLIDLEANSKRYVGRGLMGSGNGQLIEGNNPAGMLYAVDNRNVLGVAGANPGAPDSNAASASTGIEVAIPIEYLGLLPQQPLGIQVLLNSTWTPTRHPNGVSNQSLPAFPDFTASIPTGFVVDFRSYAGNQFAATYLVAEPGSLLSALVAVAICSLFRPCRCPSPTDG
jgi:hypothetical protein